jgi:hypothetical protein
MENSHEKFLHVRCLCTRLIRFFSRAGRRENGYVGRAEHVLRGLPAYGEIKPRSGAGRRQGDGVLEGKGGRRDLRRHQSRRERPYQRHDESRLPLSAQGLRPQ